MTKVFLEQPLALPGSANYFQDFDYLNPFLFRLCVSAKEYHPERFNQ